MTIGCLAPSCNVTIFQGIGVRRLQFQGLVKVGQGAIQLAQVGQPVFVCEATHEKKRKWGQNNTKSARGSASNECVDKGGDDQQGHLVQLDGLLVLALASQRCAIGQPATTSKMSTTRTNQPSIGLFQGIVRVLKTAKARIMPLPGQGRSVHF